MRSRNSARSPRSIATRLRPQSYFDQALKLDPASYAANFGLLQLYARTGDPRREEQSKRFDQIKDQKEERDRQMMRSIEIRPDPRPKPGEQ